jgi:hypothetical protein
LLQEETASRHWGRDEFERLMADSTAAGEVVDASEREAVRRVLAAIERMESLALAAARATEILEHSSGGAVGVVVTRELVAVLQEQAGHALGDAFAALVASVGRADRGGRRAFEEEAARLGALRPSASDLRSSLAAIARVSRGQKRKPKMSGFVRAIQDAVAAAAFVDRAVGRVADLLARGDSDDGRTVGRAPLCNLMSFVARSASFAQSVATLRIAAVGAKA